MLESRSNKHFHFRFNATYLLEPEDPMFVQIGNAFVEEYTKGPFCKSIMQNYIYY